MPRHGQYIAILLALSSATMLAGCTKQASRMDPAGNISTASTAPASFGAVAELGRKWEANPADVTKGLAYANALESIGQKEQQISVYAQLVQRNPDNGKLAGLYGRKLVAEGRSQEAIPVLERAATSANADWRVLSALGSAYDHQGLYQKARPHYQAALAADPQNLSVMNNLGMSFALEGNLKQAEATLRQADALPRSKSEPRIRQNLALVVGLQGRFEEASKLARQDLPPEQVEANMAYLQKMLSQPNTWQQISESGNG
jgi:Flp pilus assembly protein TadD